MTIASNLHQVEEILCQKSKEAKRHSEDIQLIAVTKAVDNESTKEIYQLGVKHLAENRPEGLLAKQAYLPQEDIIWHYIGNLQSRKVKQIINQIDYLHSLDRLSLAKEIEKRADEIVNCFVEVNVSGEMSKHGVSPEELTEFIEALEEYPKVRVVGLMTMAPLGADETMIHQNFADLRMFQQKLAVKNYSFAPCTELSMGMSNDYQIAIEEGATFIRVGTSLFKE
ncbi:YggS family pyridoxal phosphate-dependent enzyme [Carnobacterium gallinarum]|uniref:YggS family pyridoxal phosphate-dependent enzyme n=1 Tax=Carnobacterium gallinarum TaxID=2749 RepID=UPI00055918C5|nr:YggS family pyridoxal phosphate-dependent enzyme [Carnobacterium gallinarum]